LKTLHLNLTRSYAVVVFVFGRCPIVDDQTRSHAGGVWCCWRWHWRLRSRPSACQSCTGVGYVFAVRRIEVVSRFHSTCGDRCEGGMAALVERHMLTGAVWGVVGGVTVVGSHCVPERAPCPSNPVNRYWLVFRKRCEVSIANAALARGVAYDGAITAEEWLCTRVGSKSAS